MTSQLGERLLSLQMPNVHNLIFAAACHEVFVDAAKARMDCIVALPDALEAANQALVLNVPKMQALIGDI